MSTESLFSLTTQPTEIYEYLVAQRNQNAAEERQANHEFWALFDEHYNVIDQIALSPAAADTAARHFIRKVYSYTPQTPAEEKIFSPASRCDLYKFISDAYLTPETVGAARTAYAAALAQYDDPLDIAHDLETYSSLFESPQDQHLRRRITIKRASRLLAPLLSKNTQGECWSLGEEQSLSAVKNAFAQHSLPQEKADFIDQLTQHLRNVPLNDQDYSNIVKLMSIINALGSSGQAVLSELHLTATQGLESSLLHLLTQIQTIAPQIPKLSLGEFHTIYVDSENQFSRSPLQKIVNTHNCTIPESPEIVSANEQLASSIKLYDALTAYRIRQQLKVAPTDLRQQGKLLRLWRSMFGYIDRSHVMHEIHISAILQNDSALETKIKQLYLEPYKDEISQDVMARDFRMTYLHLFMHCDKPTTCTQIPIIRPDIQQALEVMSNAVTFIKAAAPLPKGSLHHKAAAQILTAQLAQAQCGKITDEQELTKLAEALFAWQIHNTP